MKRPELAQRSTWIILAAVLVVALSAPAGAKTKFKVLHNFKDGSDGANPVLFAALAMDKSGNLFGAAQAGGDIENKDCEGYGCGVAFELSLLGNGKWKERTLFEITDSYTQGRIDSPLTLDRSGNLYGCTSGYVNHAPMFELTAGSTTQWNFNPIWSSGCFGAVGLIVDGEGNLYGAFGNGTTGGVSELSPSSDGWVYTNLYEFCQQYGCPDGDNPLAPFSWDSKGNLYGTTYNGGDPRCNSCGVAFQMTPNGDGMWTYHVLHTFYQRQGRQQPLWESDGGRKRCCIRHYDLWGAL